MKVDSVSFESAASLRGVGVRRRLILATANQKSAGTPAATVSLDTWAVIIALVLALLVRVGLIHRVPW
jgi:hypothetical protein